MPLDPLIKEVLIMVTITRCDNREKNGKAFNIVYFYDERGYAGSCVMSPTYYSKVVENLESAHIGRKDGKMFLYIK